MNITHEPDKQRFVAIVDGTQAVLEYSPLADDVLDYRHTFVPETLRGRGIAKELVVYGLDHARKNHLRVRPTCPYVAKVIRENPEYLDLLATRG
jgi:hypothetical protein